MKTKAPFKTYPSPLFDVNHRRGFFEALAAFGKKFDEIQRFMTENNMKKTTEEIAMFYQSTLHDIKRNMSVWYNKQPEDVKTNYKDFFHDFVWDRNGNHMKEITVLLAHEEMRKIGYTSFQMYPNRIVSLIKLIEYGEVQVAKNCRKKNLRLPSSNVLHLNLAVKDVKKGHLRSWLIKFPRISVELRPKNIFTALIMKKLHLKPFIVARIESHKLVSDLKEKLTKFWNISSNFVESPHFIELTHACERINKCCPFEKSECNLFGDITLKYVNGENKNKNKVLYNSLQSEIDHSNIYFDKSTTTNNNAEGVNVDNVSIFVNDSINGCFNRNCCDRALVDDEVLITLSHFFYDFDKSFEMSATDQSSILNFKNINKKSSALFYYSFSHLGPDYNYDQLSLLALKTLVESKHLKNLTSNNLAMIPKSILLDASIDKKPIQNDVFVDESVNTPKKPKICNSQPSILNTSFSMIPENSMSYAEMSKVTNLVKLLPSELSTNEQSIDLFKNIQSNNPLSQLSNSSFSHSVNSFKYSESRPFKTSVQTSFDGPTNFSQLASLIKEGWSNFSSSPAKRNPNFQPNTAATVVHSPHKFIRDDDSIDMTSTFKKLTKKSEKPSDEKDSSKNA